MIGKTFYDAQFRQWEIFNDVGDWYDCEFMGFYDGFIKDTPQFKLFPKSYFVQVLKSS